MVLSLSLSPINKQFLSFNTNQKPCTDALKLWICITKWYKPFTRPFTSCPNIKEEKFAWVCETSVCLSLCVFNNTNTVAMVIQSTNICHLGWWHIDRGRHNSLHCRNDQFLVLAASQTSSPPGQSTAYQSWDWHCTRPSDYPKQHQSIIMSTPQLSDAYPSSL